MEQRCSVACFLKECINTQKLLRLNSFLFNIAGRQNYTYSNNIKVN